MDKCKHETFESDKPVQPGLQWLHVISLFMLQVHTIKLKQAPDRMCVCATSVLGADRDEALCRTASAFELWASLNISAAL